MDLGAKCVVFVRNVFQSAVCDKIRIRYLASVTIRKCRARRIRGLLRIIPRLSYERRRMTGFTFARHAFVVADTASSFHRRWTTKHPWRKSPVPRETKLFLVRRYS